MIVYLPLVNGKSLEAIKLQFLEVQIGEISIRMSEFFFSKDFPTVMKANYLVWPLIQLTNFYFMPVQHR